MDGAIAENRVRAICLALPEVTEKLSHGAPAFFVKKQFLMLWPNGHHDHGFPHLWCAAPIGAQQELTETEPDRFFRPPYVGGRGWVGLRLDGDVDQTELEAICEDAYLVVAPARLVAMLGAVRDADAQVVEIIGQAEDLRAVSRRKLRDEAASARVSRRPPGWVLGPARAA